MGCIDNFIQFFFDFLLVQAEREKIMNEKKSNALLFYSLYPSENIFNNVWKEAYFLHDETNET